MHPEAVPLFELWLILSTSSPFPQSNTSCKVLMTRGEEEAAGKSWGTTATEIFSGCSSLWFPFPSCADIRCRLRGITVSEQKSRVQREMGTSLHQFWESCKHRSQHTGCVAERARVPAFSRHSALGKWSMKTASAIALSMSCVRERPRETVSSKTAGLPGLQSILCLWEHGEVNGLLRSRLFIYESLERYFFS